MFKQKEREIKWAFFTERLSSDFPFILLYYFFIGHFKYLGFKNLLYFNKYPTAHSYRGEKELEKFYKKIKSFRRKDLINIAQEVKSTVDKLNLWLQKITPKNLERYSNLKLKQDFKEFSKILYRFTSYFVFTQYIGRVFRNREEILKIFDKQIIKIIRAEPLIPEIKKKLKVYFNIVSRKFSIKASLLFWAFPLEIENLFTKRKINVKEVEENLKKRKKYCLLIIRDGNKYIYFGLKAKEMADKELMNEQPKLSVSKISGQGIYTKTKKVKGRVKIVLGKKDFKKVKQGDILVAVTTMPYYLPILKKVKGIIANEGGLLSHTSILARELKKPAVIGTKIATKVLKDGDKVEVDANKGIVRKIK